MNLLNFTNRSALDSTIDGFLARNPDWSVLQNNRDAAPADSPITVAMIVDLPIKTVHLHLATASRPRPSPLARPRLSLVKSGIAFALLTLFTISSNPPALAATTAASSTFSCEMIKDKPTRAACIKDRTANEQAAAAQKAGEDDKQAKADAEKKRIDNMVKALQAHVVKDFKDPSSAQFAELHFKEEGPIQALCGMVNGKNSYGAYAGANKFYVRKTGDLIEMRILELPRNRDDEILYKMQLRFADIACRDTKPYPVTAPKSP